MDFYLDFKSSTSKQSNKKQLNKARLKSEELIELVREKRFLWDINDDRFKDRNLKDKQWEEIAEILGFDTNVIQVRWKSLKNNFRKEFINRCELKKTGNLSIDTQTSRWKFYRLMAEFLEKTLEFKEIELKISFKNKAVKKTTSSNLLFTEASETTIASVANRTSKSALQIRFQEMQANQSSFNVTEQSSPSAITNVIENRNITTNSDEVHLYCMSLESRFNKLSKRAFHTLKMRLETVLFEIEENDAANTIH